MGQWVKSKCQRENPSNPQLPILSFSTILKFCQNVVELVIKWSGKRMGTNSNWEEDPFLEKRVMTSLARKIPKNVCHSSIHPCFPFYLTILLHVGFLHAVEASYVFILHVFAHFPHLACPENPFWCCSRSGQGVFLFWEFMAVILDPVIP